MADTIEIKVNLENLTDAEREQLMQLVEKGNKPKSKVWAPKDGEMYHYLESSGYIDNREYEKTAMRN